MMWIFCALSHRLNTILTNFELISPKTFKVLENRESVGFFLTRAVYIASQRRFILLFLTFNEN